MKTFRSFNQVRLRAIKRFNKSAERDSFVIREIGKLEPGSKLLDAGAGSQPFRSYCQHLSYFAQDIGEFSTDLERGLASRTSDYVFGNIDYKGDVWQIDEEDNFFDAILCTEVFEHIPYAVDAVNEFFRLLKPEGRLILTAPGNSVRHFDPYYFVSGYSNHWFQRVLGDAGFEDIQIQPIGDYYSWNKIEMYRTIRSHGLFAAIFLLPALIYFGLRRPNESSRATIVQGYHVTAVKPGDSPIKAY